MSSDRDTMSGPGLGIDAGGTETRWALAAPGGAILADGVVAGLSALQMATSDGRAAVRASLEELAAAVLAHASPLRIQAGLTGFGGDDELLQAWLAQLLGVAPSAVTLSNDIELAYRANFAPGAGYLVYAGTGSIGAFIDADHVFHRAGGRGVLLDDGGGGFWIAREALRHIWRNEDEQPGCWRDSPLAQAVFDHVGGSDWTHSRQFMYGQDRGAIGRLALAVAASVEADPEARRIMLEAGLELARLANAMVRRYGPRPVVLAGRAAELHPLLAQSMRAELLAGVPLQQKTVRPHHAAARIAAQARHFPFHRPDTTYE